MRKPSILTFALPAIVGFALAVGVASLKRIETGEVGIRIGFDKQVQAGELLPGSFNQTLIGSVLTFPVKDVAAKIDDMAPQASDSSSMKDFDVTVIYSINPASAAELYGSKSKAFHAAYDGDILLMYNWITMTARNAVYKEARKYEALTMNDNRSAIESAVKAEIERSLKAEGMEGSIVVSQVQIRAITPADTVVASANDLVRAKNERAKKEVEVQTAAKEAERIAILNANKGAIDYMDAQSRQMMAQAMLQGKVQSVVVPFDFKGIIGTK